MPGDRGTQTGLEHIRKWCDNNRLIINGTKTKFTNFDLKGVSFPTKLTFHSETVQKSLIVPIIKTNSRQIKIFRCDFR